MLFVRRCLGGVRAASLLLSRCTLHCPSDLAHPRRPCPAPPAAVHALRQSASFSHSASPSSTSASSATASPPPPLLTPTLTPLPHKNPSFRDLKVHAFFISFLEKSKHLKNPTLIQTAAIPWLIRRPWNNTAFPDIVMEEMTGQGKSLAYLLPVLSNVDNYLDALQAVIVVPSRELAVQVNTVQQNNSKQAEREHRKKCSYHSLQTMRVGMRVHMLMLIWIFFSFVFVSMCLYWCVYLCLCCVIGVQVGVRASVSRQQYSSCESGSSSNVRG